MIIEEYKNIKSKTIGIYWFRNIDTNEYYVGQSLDIRRRFIRHKNNIKRKINYPIYNAINKYGWDKFEFQIEIVVDRDNRDNKTISKILDDLEIKTIEKYDSYNNGYNLTAGGASISGYHLSSELKEKYSKIAKQIQNDGRHKIYVYNILTKEYSEWKTLREFLNNYNLTTRNIISKKLVIADNQWIASKTKDGLEEKIKNIPDENLQGHNNGRTVCKNDLNNPELGRDIQNLSIKDFCHKYNVTKATYYNYLKKLGILNKTSLGKDPRIKCNKENFLKDYPNLNRKDFCKKYKISEHAYYDMKKRYL